MCKSFPWKSIIHLPCVVCVCKLCEYFGHELQSVEVVYFALCTFLLLTKLFLVVEKSVPVLFVSVRRWSEGYGYGLPFLFAVKNVCVIFQRAGDVLLSDFTTWMRKHLFSRTLLKLRSTQCKWKSDFAQFSWNGPRSFGDSASFSNAMQWFCLLFRVCTR